jgi:dihydrofolate synthase / folylpolyglutamate synthase
MRAQSGPSVGRDAALLAALQRLYARERFGIKLGLDTERAILAELGRPETGCRALHIAGTNGKGSVAALLEGMLLAAGLRTGLYTSPHLVHFNERIRIDGEPVDDAELVRLLRRVEAAADRVAAQRGEQPTFFECATAMAFDAFAAHSVESAVIETGMGGRLDATNVLTPVLSVITTIALEHTQYLGATLEAIAAEKAGILKPGVPVVCGRLPPEARAVVRRVAQACGTRCIEAEEAVSVRGLAGGGLEGQRVAVETQGGLSGTCVLPLAGAYQLTNLAVALAALEYAAPLLGFEADMAVVRMGLARTRWRARCEVLEAHPPMILDAAHNAEGAAALAHALKSMTGKRPLGLVLGVCGDKDLHGILQPFAGRARRVWAVPLRTPRGRGPDDIAAAAAVLNIPAETASLDAALRDARAWAVENDGAVAIAGSLFLAGEVLAIREGVGHDGQAERD